VSRLHSDPDFKCSLLTPYDKIVQKFEISVKFRPYPEFNMRRVGSPFYPIFLAHRTVPQQTVYRSKKYRTIQTELVLKTQFGVNRSVPKMQFFPFSTWKSYMSANRSVI
jgi:hypothetical protein